MKSKPKGARYGPIFAALGLCLAGCTGAGDITPVGPGTYMVQENTIWGRGIAAAQVAMKDANPFWGRQNKIAIMQSEQIETPATGGAAQIIFICASPGDPGYVAPNVQPTELKPTQEK